MNDKKAQATIKEMASKKLLSGEQKKVLYKLFEAKINNAKSEVINQQDKQEDAFKAELLKKAKANKAIAKMISDFVKADKVRKQSQKALEKLGFCIGGYNKEVGEISVDSHDNKEFQAFRKAWYSKANKIDELKAKLLADIYCLPMTAEEMTKYIEAEIANIIK